MRSLIMGLLALLCVCAESTVLQGIAIRGILPNLSLILVISYSLLRGSHGGRCFGLTIGLLQDVIFFNTVGFYVLLYYLLGHLCGYFCRDMNRENYVLPLLAVLAGDFLYCLINYFFLYLLAGDTGLFYYFRTRFLPEMCYTGLLTLPVYGLMTLLTRGLDTLQKRIARHRRIRES